MNASLARMTLLAALGACSFAAAAQSSVGVGVSVDTGTAQAEADTAINPPDKPATHPYCLRTTGSRIPARARTSRGVEAGKPVHHACLPLTGRVYTREDLQRTGQTDIADALRMLDPAIY
ncbi:hypothetical protein ACFFGH_05605 [Lysobacter korlensis]|uniref:Uncharacterized protein n=1 Tax=Lysobacter korlensis TaxID=553636 RepID=A0ABV6RK14_9GAMM